MTLSPPVGRHAPDAFIHIMLTHPQCRPDMAHTSHMAGSRCWYAVVIGMLHSESGKNVHCFFFGFYSALTTTMQIRDNKRLSAWNPDFTSIRSREMISKPWFLFTYLGRYDDGRSQQVKQAM